MKTPPDAFEHDLERLALRELPPQWRQEILAKAHKPRFAPPRALAFVLAAAWIIILALQILMPAPSNVPLAPHAPVFAPSSLFALNHHLDLLQP